MTPDLPLGGGLLPYDEASRLVIEFLKKAVPMGLWSVSRRIADRQIHDQVLDDAYGQRPGDAHAWSDSLCRHMVTGQAPRIAPRAMSVDSYRTAGIAQTLRIGAYIGMPLRDADGRLYGTLHGLDPEPQPDGLVDQAPVLDLLAGLLGQVIAADGLRADVADPPVKLRWHRWDDPLTGLANRARFHDRVSHAMELQQRDLRKLSVLLIDLDNFGAVNDHHGCQAADLLLVEVAKRLRGCLRLGDTVARVGGDEFAVLIEDGGEAATAAGKLVRALKDPFTVDGTPVTIGASIGVAEIVPFTGSTLPETVLANADAAMRSAKRAGGGRFDVHASP